jgi:DNA-binding FadR family transcriptional regulator
MTPPGPEPSHTTTADAGPTDPDFSPAFHGSVAERVARHLISYIQRHNLSSGEPLPSELRLSRELSVSRGMVREAIRSLSSAGVLEIANGRAPRVGRLSGRAISLLLQHGLSTEQLSQAHVFDARSTLEIRAAALAARHRTRDDLEALDSAVADMRAAGRQHAPFVEADFRFHDIIGRATGNPLFDLLGAAIRESFDQGIRAGFHSRRTPEELAELVDLHAGIVEAIAKRRPAAASRLMRQHFERMWRYVFGDTRPPA